MALDNFRTIELIWDKANKSIIKTIKTASSDTTGRYLSVKVLDGGQEVTLNNAKLQLYWEHPNFNTSGTDDFNTINNGGLFKMTFSDEMLTNIGELNAHLVLILPDGTITSDGFPIEVFKGADDGVVVPTNGSGLVKQIEGKIDKGNVTLSDLTQEVKLAMTGGTVAVVGEDSVGTENIKDGSVSADKTDFITKKITSENIVDSSKSKVGITLNTNTGEETANALYNTTDFIKVEQGITYYTPYSTRFYKFSDNKDYLGWEETSSYTAEQNGYIRVRISAGSNIPFRINIGSLKPFDEYRELLDIPTLVLDNEKIKSATFTNGELNEGLKVTEKNVNFFYRDSPNLFNKDTVTPNKRLSSANAIMDDVNNTVSDYIEVLPNTTYSVTEGSYTHFYDVDKTFISGHGVGIKTFTTPENTAYIRITVRKIKLDVFMLILGSTPPGEADYIPFNVFSFTDNVQVAREEKLFEGMKLAFNGDSIVQNGSYMLSQIKNKLGFESVKNYGIGGTAYAVRTAPWDANAISLRYGDMADDYDVIAFMAGTNDFKSAEINLDKFKEALHTTFNGLVEKYPTKKLVVFTMPPRYDRTANGETVYQYADAIMEVAGYYSIPSCDLLRNSQLRPWNEINKAEYITDGLHPETPQGYDLMLPRMIEFFKTI